MEGDKERVKEIRREDNSLNILKISEFQQLPSLLSSPLLPLSPSIPNVSVLYN